MKKYLQFNIDNKCTGVFDQPEPNTYEFDYDPALYFLPTLELKDGKVVHTMPGLTYKEQETKFNQDKEKADFQARKESIIPNIKVEAEIKIKELDWKLERAREQDLLAGTTNKTQEVLLKRQQIRDASNAHEAKLMALTTIDQLNAFDARDF